MDLSRASGRCFSSIKGANEFRLASRNLFGTRERVLSSGRRWRADLSVPDAGAHTRAAILPRVHPRSLVREMRMLLETFYVLCELCSCPLPTPPQLNIQISGRHWALVLRRLPRTPSATARNEKKVVGPRNIIIMTFDRRWKAAGERCDASMRKSRGRRINFILLASFF